MNKMGWFGKEVFKMKDKELLKTKDVLQLSSIEFKRYNHLYNIKKMNCWYVYAVIFVSNLITCFLVGNVIKLILVVPFIIIELILALRISAINKKTNAAYTKYNKLLLSKLPKH